MNGTWWGPSWGLLKQENFRYALLRRWQSGDGVVWLLVQGGVQSWESSSIFRSSGGKGAGDFFGLIQAATARFKFVWAKSWIELQWPKDAAKLWQIWKRKNVLQGHCCVGPSLHSVDNTLHFFLKLSLFTSQIALMKLRLCTGIVDTNTASKSSQLSGRFTGENYHQFCAEFFDWLGCPIPLSESSILNQFKFIDSLERFVIGTNEIMYNGHEFGFIDLGHRGTSSFCCMIDFLPHVIILKLSPSQEIWMLKPEIEPNPVWSFKFLMIDFLLPHVMIFKFWDLSRNVGSCWITSMNPFPWFFHDQFPQVMIHKSFQFFCIHEIWMTPWLKPSQTILGGLNFSWSISFILPVKIHQISDL